MDTDSRYAVLWINTYTGQAQGWTGLRWSPYQKHWLWMTQALAQSLIPATQANMGYGGHAEVFERPAKIEDTTKAEDPDAVVSSPEP